MDMFVMMSLRRFRHAIFIGTQTQKFITLELGCNGLILLLLGRISKLYARIVPLNCFYYKYLNIKAISTEFYQ